MKLCKGKIFTSIIGYTVVILLLILWTGNVTVKQYSFFARFQILMSNLTRYHTMYDDPSCDVKYAFIVFKRGIDSSNFYRLSHKEQNRVRIFSSGRGELLLYGASKHHGNSLTVQDLLNNITHNKPGCWRNLKFVVFCRNTTLVNVKNIVDMLESTGKLSKALAK